MRRDGADSLNMDPALGQKSFLPFCFVWFYHKCWGILRRSLDDARDDRITTNIAVITNVFSRNSDVSLFHNSEYLAVMETISQNSFRRQRYNEVPGICLANSLPKLGFDSGKHRKCFPSRHIHYKYKALSTTASINAAIRSNGII